jgi:hypothetical protein
MINLHNYILEKLHLNKDINLSNVLDKIEYLSGLNGSRKELTDVIKDWIDDNEVSDVSVYMPTDNKDILQEYNVKDELINEIIFDDKVIKELKDKETIQSLYKNVNDTTSISGNEYILVIAGPETETIVKKEN